jgi:hypothetical protein
VALSMNQALQHGHALVNGYSGFFPSSYRQATHQLASFPDETSLAYLHSIGVAYLVIDTDWLAADTREQLRASPQVERVYSGSTKLIYALSASSSSP